SLEALRKPNGDPIDEVTADDDRFVLFKQLSALSREPGEKALPLALASDPEAARYFQEKGVVVPAVKGVPFDSYVFKDTYRCLRDQQGFRGMNNQEIKTLAEEVVRSRASNRGHSYNRAEDEKKIIQAFTAFPECTDVGKHSQMGEVMADYFGSKV